MVKNTSVWDKCKSGRFQSERARKYLLALYLSIVLVCISIGFICQLLEPPVGTPEYFEYRRSLMSTCAGFDLVGFMLLPTSLTCTKMGLNRFFLALLVLFIISIALIYAGDYLIATFPGRGCGIIFGAGLSMFIGCPLALWILFMGSRKREKEIAKAVST